MLANTYKRSHSVETMAMELLLDMFLKRTSVVTTIVDGTVYNSQESVG